MNGSSEETVLEARSEIRPEERRGALSAFFTLFGILASHTILETARDALFLARLSPKQLPWVYLALAGISVLLSHGPVRAPRRLRSSYGLSVLLLTCSVVTLGFWVVGRFTDPWLLRALYVWTGLVGTLTGLQFWLVLGELYTITQAKRVYRYIAMGSLLGALAGAVTARSLASGDPGRLVLVASLVLAATAVGPAVLLKRPAMDAPRTGEIRLARFAQIPAVLRRQPYVFRLAGFVLISTVALTLGDYVFKETVAHRVAAADLPTFFATVAIVLNALALTAQALLTGWLLRSFGLHRALWVLPALLLMGAGGIAFGGGLAAALLLKGADGTLRHSLHRTSSELLYLPIPDGLRARVKPLIDIVGQRGGQALASVFLLGELGLDRGDAVLAAAAGGLCILWIVWAADLKPHYLDLFRTTLRDGTMPRRPDLPDLDLASLEALFAALNSRDDGEVAAALDMLAQEERIHLVPALVLYHPSKTVVLGALDHFTRARRTDFVPIADRLMTHPDPEVRAAALRSRTATLPDEPALRRAAEDPSPLVRATALVGLVAGGFVTDDAQRLLDELIDASGEARRALVRAVAEQPAAAFEDTLLDLAREGDDLLLSEVARAMGALRSERFLPALLPFLVLHEVRPAARDAFLAYGERGLRFLDEALADEDLPQDLRRHIPRTLSRFPDGTGAPVLLKHLLGEKDGMVRFKILRGLGRIATNHPDLSLDQGILRRATDQTADAALRLATWRTVLQRGALEDPSCRTPGHELLLALLHDKETHAAERVFRLLALRRREEDWEGIYRGLRSQDAKIRASSRELLENLVEVRLRRVLLAAAADAEAEALPEDLRAEAVRLPYNELLERLLDEPSETLRCIAAYHVGEIRIEALRPRLEALQAEERGLFLTQTMARALALLGPPPWSLQPHA